MTATFSNPFDVAEQKYRSTQRPQTVQKLPQQQAIKTSPFDIAEQKLQQKFPFEEEGELEKEMERSQARAISRVGETILGAPGDILSFGAFLLGKELPEFIPTSEKLKKFSEETTRGYTAPKTEFEEKTDELTRDIASFALPGSKSYTAARNIGIPIVANLAKEGIKYFGADDKKSSMAKIGLMIGLDLASQRKGMGGGAKQFASNLFKQAEEAIPPGELTDATSLSNSLNSLEEVLKKGGTRPSSKEALTKVKEIKNEIKGGKIDVKSLAAFRPSINELIDQFGGFELQLPKSIKQKGIFNLNQVKNKVIEGLSDYGKKSNPEFLKLHRSANEAWAAYQNSNKISKFIEKHAGKFIKNPLIQKLFLGGAAVCAHSLGTTGTLLGGGLAIGYPSFKILHRVMNSPTLRTYYTNIIKGSLSGNASQVSKNMKLLDRELSKEPPQKGSVEE